MTAIEFWTEGDYDAWAEYQAIKARRRSVSKAIRNAITLVWRIPPPLSGVTPCALLPIPNTSDCPSRAEKG